MESITKMQLVALSRAGYQDPSVRLGNRCVEGDLRATRGQVRPMTGAVAGSPVRIRPAAFPFVTQIGAVLTGPAPGGLRT